MGGGAFAVARMHPGIEGGSAPPRPVESGHRLTDSTVPVGSDLESGAKSTRTPGECLAV